MPWTPPIIRQIVGRLHVGARTLQVARYTTARVVCGRRGWLRMPRTRRRYLLACAIIAHAENRALYLDVARGTLKYRAGKDAARYSPTVLRAYHTGRARERRGAL